MRLTSEQRATLAETAGADETRIQLLTNRYLRGECLSDDDAALVRHVLRLSAQLDQQEDARAF